MKSTPLISVIALCYNHEKYLWESLLSVVNQSYSAIELIIVDDCSTDNSRQLIEAFTQKFPAFIIFNDVNQGNCRSFNKALSIAQGIFIIDLATDDVMLPNRLMSQIELFNRLDENVGIVFSNAVFINEHAEVGKLLYSPNQIIPEGDIYTKLLTESYILPATMMIRKTVLEQLNGYDESLAYEDFDFWVRSSRQWHYAYCPEVLMQQRKLSGSLSTKFLQKNNLLVPSTVEVCKKAAALNRTVAENQALIIRLRRALRQCIVTENYQAGQQTITLLHQLSGHNWQTRLLTIMNSLKLPIYFLYQWYKK